MSELTPAATDKLLDVLRLRAQAKRIQTLQRQADKDHAQGLHETARGTELLIDALKRKQEQERLNGKVKTK